MAYDEGHAQILRDDLAGLGGVREVRMMGGLCFMLDGHMVCGLSRDGGMFRVGKAAEAAALAIAGAAPLGFTGRRMSGLIEVSDAAFEDDDRRGAWLAMALEHARGLPPK